MKFGSVSVDDAAGGILAHSVRTPGVNFRKGRILSSVDVALLASQGIASVTVARLEAGDVAEDNAAARIAQALAGSGVRVGASFTGRANLYAQEHGLALVDAPRISAANLIDESITIATLAPHTRVAPRQMLATVKIIPFAAPEAAVAKAEATLVGSAPALAVMPFRPKRAALISTVLPGTKASIPDLNRRALDARFHSIGSEIVFERRVPHTADALAAAIREALSAGADPILVFGASAITDRRDVVPSAIADAGGEIEHFGMPVDPGNLLLLGRVRGTQVVGLPSCARSPKLNGIDFVLWRIAAGLTVDRREIAALGVGGLLTEIPTRPQPRDEPPVAVPRLPRIAGIVLAAGKASRMGSNKMLAAVNGKPLVRSAAEAALGSAAQPIIVVTGNEANSVQEALSDLSLSTVNNPDYTRGLSTSLRCGLNALPSDTDGAIILLGDMPGITSRLIDRMIAAFDPAEGRGICVASFQGKRGNPVLWARRFFPEMERLEGDTGAKQLLAQYEELVCEVEAGNDAPLVDIDTPEELAAFRAR